MRVHLFCAFKNQTNTHTHTQIVYIQRKKKNFDKKDLDAL